MTSHLTPEDLAFLKQQIALEKEQKNEIFNRQLSSSNNFLNELTSHLPQLATLFRNWIGELLATDVFFQPKALDILNGNGPLGKRFKEHAEFHRLFNRQEDGFGGITQKNFTKLHTDNFCCQLADDIPKDERFRTQNLLNHYRGLYKMLAVLGYDLSNHFSSKGSSILLPIENQLNVSAAVCFPVENFHYNTSPPAIIYKHCLEELEFAWDGVEIQGLYQALKKTLSEDLLQSFGLVSEETRGVDPSRIERLKNNISAFLDRYPQEPSGNYTQYMCDKIKTTLSVRRLENNSPTIQNYEFLLDQQKTSLYAGATVNEDGKVNKVKWHMLRGSSNQNWWNYEIMFDLAFQLFLKNSNECTDQTDT